MRVCYRCTGAFKCTLATPRALLTYGGEFAENGEFAVLNWRREDEACNWIAVGQQGFDQCFKISEICGGHFEQEVVAAGEMVAFADLFECLDVFEEPVVILTSTTHADESQDFETEGFAVDLEGIASQDADFFHLFEAFAGCRGGQANAAAEFRETQTRVGLQFVQKLSPVNVEQRRGIHCHNRRS